MGDPESKSRVHVRPVSREPTFAKLRALKCFEEVHQHILDGWSPNEVAKFIQEEQGEYLESSRANLIWAVKQYRSSIPPGELVERRMPAAFNSAAKKLEKGVDEVKELEWLSMFQKRRLKIDANTEKKINKLLPSMTQEVRAHVEVLRTLASVKMDLGVNKRHLGSLEVDATLLADVTARYGTSSVARVLQSSESRQKVMGVAEKFLALAAKEVEGDEEEAETVEAAPTPEPKAPPKPEPSK